jgi:hypothetical protein
VITRLAMHAWPGRQSGQAVTHTPEPMQMRPPPSARRWQGQGMPLRGLMQGHKRKQVPLLSTLPAGQPQTPSLLLVEPPPVPPSQWREQHWPFFLHALPLALHASAALVRLWPPFRRATIPWGSSSATTPAMIPSAPRREAGRPSTRAP